MVAAQDTARVLVRMLGIPDAAVVADRHPDPHDEYE